MKIALIGYGKMGKTIHALASQKGHTITCTIDNQQEWDKTCKPLGEVADVAIEFSIPEAATQNILRCFKENIPVVCGTTGWLHDLGMVTEACNKANGTLIYAPNFSPGVNLFFSLNEWMGKLMNKFPDYDTSIEEIHHTQKLDAPSGTAIHLANKLIEEMERLKKWVPADEASEDLSELTVFSERIEQVTGIHTVTWESEIDQIQIRHTAKNRSGFAYGAVLSAEWIHKNKKKGVFPFQKILFNAF